MGRFLKRLFSLMLVVALLACAAVGWADYQYRAAGPLATEKTVLLKRGTGFEAIAEQLAAEGVVKHDWFFKGAALVSGQAVRFKAGEYAFPAGVSVKDAIAMLAEGRVVVHKITIAEGLTLGQVRAILNAEPLLEGEIPVELAEGTLLPETYHYTYGDTRESLVRRMQADMRRVLAELWDKRKEGLPLANPQEALVLASIVEKETGVDGERGRVAAVYINRLRQGMKLQADPTVAYGIEVQQGKAMDRPLTTADLQEPTPYNTYVIPGLPPTPIANPGRAALEATLNPPDTQDLFFVATGRGGHAFGTTLEEHNRNVAAYRAVMREEAGKALPEAKQ